MSKEKTFELEKESARLATEVVAAVLGDPREEMAGHYINEVVKLALTRGYLSGVDGAVLVMGATKQ